MKRAQRLQPVHELARETERSCAARVAGMERRLADSEARLQELRRYHGEYQQAWQSRASAGLEVRSVREYQTFMAKLAGALEAQLGIVERLRADCDQERQQLRQALAHRLALGKVIEKAHSEERAMEDRKVQRELDERAQYGRTVPR